MPKLLDGVKFCKLVNEHVEALGGHVALTGGCLYKDDVRKDIDIIIYRRKSAIAIDQKKLLDMFASLGCHHIMCYGRVTKMIYEGLFDIDVIQPEVTRGDYANYDRVEDKYGTKIYYLGDELHRLDGPAVERADGEKHWYLNGTRHREDGPAIEYVDGTKAWYLNGKLHREDGPAIECADGDKVWYLNGKELTKEGFISLELELDSQRDYIKFLANKVLCNKEKT